MLVLCAECSCGPHPPPWCWVLGLRAAPHPWHLLVLVRLSVLIQVPTCSAALVLSLLLLQAGLHAGAQPVTASNQESQKVLITCIYVTASKANNPNLVLSPSRGSGSQQMPYQPFNPQLHGKAQQ